MISYRLPMSIERSPAFAARMLGHELVKLRTHGKLSQADVDERLPDMSVSKLGRLERGEGGKPKIRDIEALVELYGADEETATAIRSLTAAAREAQRWFNPAVLSRSFRSLMEEAAVRHRAWECQHVPGLLQTEDYARTILETNPEASPEEIEDRLQYRLGRQVVLGGDNPLQLWAILDEDVLHRPVGGSEVMRAQLVHIVEMAKLRTVTVQVVPRSVGAHFGMGAAFMMLDFAEEAGTPAVFLDTVTGGLRGSQSNDVARFDRLWEHLRTLALNPTRSVKLINEVANNL
jgi:transcriptional regulator with XRE-family HTH domain